MKIDIVRWEKENFLVFYSVLPSTIHALDKVEWKIEAISISYLSNHLCVLNCCKQSPNDNAVNFISFMLHDSISLWECLENGFMHLTSKWCWNWLRLSWNIEGKSKLKFMQNKTLKKLQKATNKNLLPQFFFVICKFYFLKASRLPIVVVVVIAEKMWKLFLLYI